MENIRGWAIFSEQQKIFKEAQSRAELRRKAEQKDRDAFQKRLDERKKK